MLADLRLASRQLNKAPGFCAVVILTLALSIGSCITIFSLINSVLLAGYGADPARSVALVQMRASSTTPIFVPGDDWSVWEQKLRSFELLMAHRPAPSTFTGVGEPLRVEAKVVTSHYFAFYGERFLLGRSFLPEEHMDDASGSVPNQPVGSIVPLQEFVDGRVSARRFEIQLLSAFSLLALVMAMVGIYGIISYTVSQRTAEIGIRIALGAQARDVVRLVFTEGARIVSVGLLLGLAGALAAGRLIEARMFQTSSADPLTLGGIVLLLAAVAALACWVPARRATKVDPIIALRAE